MTLADAIKRNRLRESKRREAFSRKREMYFRDTCKTWYGSEWESDPVAVATFSDLCRTFLGPNYVPKARP